MQMPEPNKEKTLADIARRAKGFCSSAIGADYSDEEQAFSNALDQYKRDYRRPFPTSCEILAVLKMVLGYRKQPESQGQSE